MSVWFEPRFLLVACLVAYALAPSWNMTEAASGIRGRLFRMLLDVVALNFALHVLAGVRL